MVITRAHSLVNGTRTECMVLKRTMPDDVLECNAFRARGSGIAAFSVDERAALEVPYVGYTPVDPRPDPPSTKKGYL